MNGQRTGIDLGGTKIEGIVIADDGTVLARERIPTPRDDYDAIIDAIATLLRRIAAHLPPDAPVGIGTPGSTSLATGKLRNSNSTCLNGRCLGEDLEHRLGRPVRLANDADCFTLSEATDGAAAGADSVFGVILGTGVGGGICVKGQILQGVNGIAGEWGHNRLARVTSGEPRACFCGRNNCIETWLSGPGLSLTCLAATGRNLSAGAIAEAAIGGDPVATRLLEDYCDLLALALATVINVVDPQVIVLGGGLSNIRLIYERVPALLGRYVFSDQVTTRLIPALHGDSSGVRGAAWLWPAS